MNKSFYIWVGILIMALSTYAVRVIPLMLFRKKIKNQFVQSFLFYVPYAVLSAMTFPAIFYSTDSLVSALAGTLAALVSAYWDKSLLFVAIAAALASLAAVLLGF